MTAIRPLLPLASAALFAFAGCASNVPLDQSANKAPVEQARPVNPNANANANTSRVAPVEVAASNVAQTTDLPRVVYFDFDSFVIKDEARGTLEAHAKRLTANRQLREVVEGHTDERGGSEYNLALGNKRATAVVKSLTLLGAQADQLEAVSFGKERPAAEGHTEEAWAKNRRAELKDR